MWLNKKNIINISSYLFTVVLLIVIFKYLVKGEQVELLKKIDLFSLLSFIGLVMINHLCNGFQYFLMRERYGIDFEKKDVILLPVVMNFWSFIVPFHGSAIFFTLFMRRKYNVKIADSFSITIFLYLITLLFSGLFGILFVLYYQMGFSLFTFISLILLFNPLFIIICYRVLLSFPNIRNKFLLRIFEFIKKIIANINSLWLDYKTTLVVLLLYVVRTLNTTLLFWLIARTLGYYEVGFLALLLLSLWRNVSLVLRFTPNNLGVVQIVSGAVFSLIHCNPEQGIMISLVSAAVSAIVAVTIGLGGNFYYFHSWYKKATSEKLN